jgi:hypothetical protein
MLQGEAWQGMGEYRVSKHYRQRVRARRRMDQQTVTVGSKLSTSRRMKGMLSWWFKRWLPWYAAPEGGRL